VEFNLVKLEQHIPLKPLPIKSTYKNPLVFLHSEEGYRTATALKPIVQPLLRVFYEGFSEQIDPIKYCLLIDSIHGMGGEYDGHELIKTLALDEDLLHYRAQKLGLSDKTMLRKIISNEEFEISYEHIIDREIFGDLNVLGSTVLDIIGILQASEALDVPAAISRRFPKRYSKGENSIPKMTTNEDMVKCFYIFLEEVDSFPIISSIDDVLRLREDKLMKNWRESIGLWANEIKLGNPMSERKMRQAIRKAVKDLKRLGPVRNISSLMAIISLPIAIAELMTGIIGPGFTITGLSTAMELYLQTIQWKNRWLLLGRSY
jgi:hypothetical protein